MALHRAIQRHFDPDKFLNPAGSLALDLPDE